MTAGLLLDDIPPLRVPLRFFLTAPPFGILAGLSWLVEGDGAFVLRWTGGMLAATHLFTLGFMAMVMIGALFQVVPVLGGGAIPMAVRIAPWVHAALTGGVLALANGLYSGSGAWIIAGLALLAVAFGIFVPLLAYRVLRRARGGDAMYTIRFAVLSLLVTLGLGVALAIGVAFPSLGLPFRDWTNVHAAWGLCGWVLLLIMGVSYQVVPMFYVTPPMPAVLVRTLAPAVFVSLLALSFVRQPAWVLAAASLLTFAGATYAVAMLVLLALRRRRRAEPAVRAWQLALLCLIASLLCGWKIIGLAPLPLFSVPAQQEGMLLGVLFGLGCATTVIFGMLGKIVPFLAFTHLQRRCLQHFAALPVLPAMNQIVTDGAAFAQLGLHLLACGLAVAAVLDPGLGRAAGVAVIADFGLCFVNMTLAAWRYRRAARAIAAMAAAV